MAEVRVVTPVDAHGNTGDGWGRAHWMAVGTVSDGTITDWQVHEVAWDVAHDQGSEGAHHARIARFLKEQGVQVAVLRHCGGGMQRMLTKMGIPLLAATEGDAQASVLAAIEAGPSGGAPWLCC